MATLKRNFFYSFFLTTSNYLMSLVVFPYVSRVLGPESLGLVSFVNGTVGCFTLLATMGINSLGIREVARWRHNHTKLSEIYSSLLALSIISTIIGVAGFITTCILIPNLREHRMLVAFGVPCIIFQVLVIEWFYKGIEDFRYITIRGVIVKTCYIVAVFLFIKNPNDYVIYFILITATFAINAIINLIHTRKFARFSFHTISIRQWIRPFLYLGSYTILGALYTTFNLLFLGIVTNDTQVVYYAVSVKVFTIILGTFTALTSVLMPRMSAMLANKQEQEFIHHVKRTISTFTVLAIPLTILGITYSPIIVTLIAGDAYAPAILPMQILMPLIFLIGYEQILVVQILTPLNRDRLILRNSLLTAVLAIVLNFCIVKALGATGSAIIWTSCELFLVILSQIYTSRLTGISFPWKEALSILTVCLPGITAIIIINQITENIWLQAILGTIFFLSIYLSIQLFITKNEACKQLVAALSKKQSGKNQ